MGARSLRRARSEDHIPRWQPQLGVALFSAQRGWFEPETGDEGHRAQPGFVGDLCDSSSSGQRGGGHAASRERCLLDERGSSAGVVRRLSGVGFRAGAHGGAQLISPRRSTTRVSRLLWLIMAGSLSVGYAHAQTPSSSPPMGWSAWDAYGASVSEADFRANAAQMAKLRSYGWQYAMLDYGWYIAYPENAHSSKTYAWDASGRLIPEIERFPSADGGKGFKPLADWLHARGLKLGIHVMLGIPRQVVDLNLPIAGSAFHASEAADAADAAQTCSWDGEFQVVKDNAAGQAYYDSIARLYADWGVDLIKLGCVADHPFHASEIRQMSLAIRR